MTGKQDFQIVSEFGSMLGRYEEAISSRRYQYTSSEKSLMFSAVAVGAIISVYPSMIMLQVGMHNTLRLLMNNFMGSKKEPRYTFL